VDVEDPHPVDLAGSLLAALAAVRPPLRHEAATTVVVRVSAPELGVARDDRVTRHRQLEVCATVAGEG
jgi:hypothetical protein